MQSTRFARPCQRWPGAFCFNQTLLASIARAAAISERCMARDGDPKGLLVARAAAQVDK